MRYNLVVDWFEVWSQAYWLDYLGAVRGRIGAAVQRACARVPQRAFCFSRLHSERLRALGLQGSITLLGGLYAGSAEGAAPREADALVLFAGRLIPEKRVALGVAAVAAAARRVPGLRAIFYGDGPDRDALHAAIAQRGAEAIIDAPGFVEAERVEADMRRALCLLLPSSREGYGMVVVEASAAATPSIVVRAEDNAATELVEEGINGVVVAAPDIDALADAIFRIYDAGLAMRESTARWYADHARGLSIDSSLATVLASYGHAGTGAAIAHR